MCPHSISHLLIFFLTKFPTKPECVSHINDNKSKKKDFSESIKQHWCLAEKLYKIILCRDKGVWLTFYILYDWWSTACWISERMQHFLCRISPTFAALSTCVPVRSCAFLCEQYAHDQILNPSNRSWGWHLYYEGIRLCLWVWLRVGVHVCLAATYSLCPKQRTSAHTKLHPIGIVT